MAKRFAIDTSVDGPYLDAEHITATTHVVSVLADAEFALVDGPTIRCDGVPGLSAVAVAASVRRRPDGCPCVELRRVLTHFHFDEPELAIEQHHARESSGTLTGLGTGSLLPGRATFTQHLIVTLAGRPLANPLPLVMTADRVDTWPPMGTTFASDGPTPFVDLGLLDEPGAPIVGYLIECRTVSVADIGPVMPEGERPRRFELTGD
jgi:hypothetical protein